MKILSITEFRTNLYEIAKMIENGEEDCVIVTRYLKPILRITPENNNRSKPRIGIAKGIFKIPDDFDVIDISSDYTEEIFN